MIYLNSNKFLLNEFNSYKDYKDDPSDKEAVTKIIRNIFDISSDYSIFFINNIYEAYKLLIHSIVSSFSDIKKKPNVIANRMEDPKILSILDEFERDKLITVSYVKSNIYGTINVDDIENHMQKNKTCLLINSFNNYFTGSINNVTKIGELAHKYKIPLFCDCVYSFGKLPIKPKKQNIDVLTFDLDYPGLSFIVINNNLLDGYKLDKYSVKFDGGVEKFAKEDPYIYGLAKSILTNIYKNRRSKNSKLISLKKSILKEFNDMYYSEFISRESAQNTFEDTHNKKKSKTSQPKGATNTKDVTNTKDTTRSKKTDADNPDILIFGNDIANENVCSPHILSVLKIKGKYKPSKSLALCDYPKQVFSNIGVNDNWHKRIITIGLSDCNTQKDIAQIIKLLLSA